MLSPSPPTVLTWQATKVDPTHAHTIQVRAGLVMTQALFAKAGTLYFKALQRRKTLHAFRGEVGAVDTEEQRACPCLFHAPIVASVLLLSVPHPLHQVL